jgi:hypothetical protein
MLLKKPAQLPLAHAEPCCQRTHILLAVKPALSDQRKRARHRI